MTHDAEEQRIGKIAERARRTPRAVKKKSYSKTPLLQSVKNSVATFVEAAEHIINPNDTESEIGVGIRRTPPTYHDEATARHGQTEETAKKNDPPPPYPTPATGVQSPCTHTRAEGSRKKYPGGCSPARFLPPASHLSPLRPHRRQTGR